MRYKLPDGREIEEPSLSNPLVDGMSVIKNPDYLPSGSLPVKKETLSPNQTYGTPYELNGEWYYPAKDIPIDSIIEKKKNELIQKRDRDISAGFDHNGHHYGSNPEARAELTEITLGFLQGMRTSVDYSVDKQSTQVTHDSTSWQGVMNAYANHKENIWNKFKIKMNELSNSTTIEEIQSITWD